MKTLAKSVRDEASLKYAEMKKFTQPLASKWDGWFEINKTIELAISTELDRRAETSRLKLQ